jgi:hypothetical protein
MINQKDLLDRIEQLEKRLRLTWGVIFVIVVTAIVIYIKNSQTDGVLRVKGVIIEDDEGRERILMGTPIPNVPGRVRKDSTDGILILNDEGVDRISIGSPVVNPQVKGKVYRRFSPHTGIAFNANDGDERGALGITDQDQVLLGLDREGAEGAVLFVQPNGVSGLRINGLAKPDFSAPERIFLGVDSPGGNSRIILNDSSGTRKSVIMNVDR